MDAPEGSESSEAEPLRQNDAVPAHPAKHDLQRAAEVDRPAGVEPHGHVEAEAHRVEGRIGDAIVGRQAR